MIEENKSIVTFLAGAKLNQESIFHQLNLLRGSRKQKVVVQCDPKKILPNGGFPPWVFENKTAAQNDKMWLYRIWERKRRHARTRRIHFRLRFRTFIKWCRKTNYHRLRGYFPHEMNMDRFDNTRGYNLRNIQMISGAANWIKYRTIDKDRPNSKRKKVTLHAKKNSN